MTTPELVRTVRSGIVGLDLALAGGFRLVKRAGTDAESAMVLIRGGPGTGKSVLAQDLALRLARASGGDAVYACVEILPTEVLAQRAGFDGYDPRVVVDLASAARRDPDVAGPSLAVGLREFVVGGQQDVGAMLLDLARTAEHRGFSPRVMVLDCLSDGYDLGSRVPRESVDGLCKLAGEQGWTLILVEEAIDERPSPWAFAVDTVLGLRLSERAAPTQATRELLVTKHRFGGSEPGPHRVVIDRDRLRVIPPLDAYRNATRDLILPKPAVNRTLFPAAATRAGRTEDRVTVDKGALVTCVTNDFASMRRILFALVNDRDTQPILVFDWKPHRFPELQGDGVSWVSLASPFMDGPHWIEAVFHELASVDALGRLVILGVSTLGNSTGAKESFQRALTLLADVGHARGIFAYFIDKEQGFEVEATFQVHKWLQSKASPGDEVIRFTSRGKEELFSLPSQGPS